MKATLENFVLIAFFIVIASIVIGFGYDIKPLQFIAAIGFLAMVIAVAMMVLPRSTSANEAWERQSLDLED